MTADVHLLSGPYVLNAVSQRERVLFERHLAGCAMCAEEVLDLRAVAARLGQAARAAPPPALKHRVMQAVRATRQHRPDTGGLAHPGRRSRWPRLGTAAAVTCAVIIGLGVQLSRARQESDQLAAQLAQDRSHSSQVLSILTAPDAQLIVTSATAAGAATIALSAQRDALVLLAADLPHLPDSQTYQPWLLGPDDPRAGGILHLGHAGLADPVVLTGIRSAHNLAVSIEPASGSTRPTTTPVLLFTLHS